MLHIFSLQMNMMNINKKQVEEKRELDIFFPRHTKRLHRNECPVNEI